MIRTVIFTVEDDDEDDGEEDDEDHEEDNLDHNVCDVFAALKTTIHAIKSSKILPNLIPNWVSSRMREKKLPLTLAFLLC